MMNQQVAEADKFQSIRPYHDHEVTAVIARLLQDKEFVDTITHYQFPRLAKWGSPVLRPLVKRVLRKRFGDMKSISDVQNMVAEYMDKMASRTTQGVTCSGLEKLDPNQAYLFISNHRDIAMDPALINWVCYKQGMDTVRIAIGDNLLRKPYVSDLMRLNKSFIVNRSARGRELLTASTLLSEYIHSSIASGNPVWIAQREGRAKDGNDRTDPAILKMFYMSCRKKCTFPEAIAQLNIVPVAISYEYLPCDVLKARELEARTRTGSYEKRELEDIESIALGITGFKGHVHLAFGEPIKDGFTTPEELAKLLDRRIQGNYHLHPTNLLAAGELVNHPEQARFEQRLQQADNEQMKEVMRQMYANPVYNRRYVEREAPADAQHTEPVVRSVI